MHTFRKLSVALLATALLLSACGSDDGQSSRDPITVVATTTILGDVVANVVGDNATVDVLLPIGASPHDYQASAQQVAAIQTADLVVANGLLLEEGLSDVLESARADGANILEIGPLLDPIPFAGDAHGHDGGDDEEAESLDPHVWLDPVRMADAALLIADRMAAIDDSVDWRSAATAYSAELLDADARIREALASLAEDQRKLVTNHGSFGYFALRYDLELIGVVIPGGSTLADPSSAELSELVEEIEHEAVAAIFGETTESTAVAEAVAAELGRDIAVVELYTGSLGETGSGAETLIDMLLTNANRIADALG